MENLTKMIQNIYLNWHMFHTMVDVFNCAPDDSWFSMNKDACGIYAFDSAGGEINHHYFPSSAIYRTFPRTSLDTYSIWFSGLSDLTQFGTWEVWEGPDLVSRRVWDLLSIGQGWKEVQHLLSWLIELIRMSVCETN